MINMGFEETLERTGDARGDVKSKCSACVFESRDTGKKVDHRGFSHFPSNAWSPGPLLRLTHANFDWVRKRVGNGERML